MAIDIVRARKIPLHDGVSVATCARETQDGAGRRSVENDFAQQVVCQNLLSEKVAFGLQTEL